MADAAAGVLERALRGGDELPLVASGAQREFQDAVRSGVAKLAVGFGFFERV